MVKQLFVADIHANYVAYDEFIRKLAKSDLPKYDGISCLGDVMGYYAEPIKTLKALYDIIQYDEFRPGNHDIMLSRFLDKQSLRANDIALLCIAVQHSILQNEAPELLAEMTERFAPRDLQLPFCIELDNYRVVLVHGNPHTYDDKNKYQSEDDMDLNSYDSVYMRPILSEPHIANAMRFLKERHSEGLNGRKLILVFGHSHLPTFANLQNDRIHYLNIQYTDPTTNIDCPMNIMEMLEQINGGSDSDEISVLAINPGSIGQPRDGIGYINEENTHTHAHAVLFDDKEHTLRFLSVPYAIRHVEKPLRRILPSDVLDDKTHDALHHYMKQYYLNNSGISEKAFELNPTLVTEYGTSSDMIKRLNEADPSTPEGRETLNAIYDALWLYKVKPKLMSWLSDPIKKFSSERYVYNYTATGAYQR